MIDLHSHILPGLDDGAKNIEETLEILGQLEKAGFKTILATPHVFEEREFLSPQEILNAVEQVRKGVSEAGISIEILPGAENYIFPDMAKWARDGKLLTLGDSGKYLLLELPMIEIPRYTEQVFFELQAQGIRPVLAHPERYKGLYDQPGLLIKWAKMGTLFQLNLKSISGVYGSQAKQLIKTILSSGLGHFVGSDAHRVSSSDESAYIEPLRKVKEIIGNQSFQELTMINPDNILAGNDFKEAGDYSLKEPVLKNEKRRMWDWLKPRGHSSKQSL